MPTKGDITLLLDRVAQGDLVAKKDLIARVYRELRDIAGQRLRREGVGHTLQATALVHEAYLRLVQQSGDVRWSGRAHFFAVASKLMRNILVDHARAKRAQKRGPERVAFDLERCGAEGIPYDRILLVNDALDELSRLSARQGQVVEMRFFGGLTEEEVAEVLGLSERTVKRDWLMAKAWLQGRLG